jgi:hypothetical protein
VVVTKVVVDPSGNVDVIVTGTVVVDRLSDGAGGLAPALVLSVAPAVGAGELDSSASGVVATNVDDGVSEGVSAEDTPDEVGLRSVETGIEVGIELAPEVVVTAASVDVVCPLADACVSVWPGGATEPELDGGGGGDWPDGRTTYLQSLSSRTDWVPSPPVIGVRVTLQVCVIVPT